MKKVSIIMLLVLFSGTLYAQETYKYVFLEDLDKQWATKPIKKGVDKEVLDQETSLTVTVDTKNGYVCVGDGGTDGEYMSACYWNRSNGHKLLAVLLGKPTDPCIEVLCTYDYDPQKKMLTPEPDILKGYRWGDKGEYNQIFCNLPKKGKDITVDDWSGDDGPVRHTFTWDGMKPVYSKTEPYEYDDGLSPITVRFKGTQPNVKDFVTALLAPNETDESRNGLRQAWDFYKNGMAMWVMCPRMKPADRSLSVAIGTMPTDATSWWQSPTTCSWTVRLLSDNLRVLRSISTTMRLVR